MGRLTIGDIDSLPLFLKPKELKKLLPLSEPTLYQLINQKGCPRIQIGEGRSCLIPTQKFITWLEQQAV